ncbi:hypothetical protein GWK47_041337 [Chionoecetes opilio]|uniref:Uncharacterized protein n=1 Tax=Chionoecetes opilio TaxID=41210 RepID=A0A8J4YI13_CHIOP|nr:hypothetical protein GWK47_041337 [Chionoecetes opilio]
MSTLWKPIPGQRTRKLSSSPWTSPELLIGCGHSGLITKLRSMGVTGGLLHLLHDYLRKKISQRGGEQTHFGKNTRLELVSDKAVFLDPYYGMFFLTTPDAHPEAHAYADDCTLTSPGQY